MIYRPDIDGLRAFAVLSVVGYHAFPSIISGGFVGVDVFFVISGYLICSIVLSDIRAARFTFVNFYERRIRRLFPALFVVVAASTFAAWVMFLPEDMKNFGQSLFAASLFSSNILFFLEDGYFDAAAEFKPLLHTWSLAVEEQFYLVFPVVLLLGFRFLQRQLAILIIALGVASLGIAIWQVEHHPDAAFYLLPSRFWQLLLGAILVFSPSFPTRFRRYSGLFALLGLALILGPVVIYTERLPFPGLLALPPCIGAALVIQSGSANASAVHRTMGHRVFVFFGLISYSLYLWHWPALVFAKYYAVRSLTTAETILVVAIAILIATLSWRFIELPFRRKDGEIGRRSVFIAASSATLILVGLGLAVSRFDGFPTRIPAQIRAMNSETPYLHARRDCHFASQKNSAADFCVRGAEAASPRFILLGDSHADMHGPGIFAAATSLGISGVQFTDYGYVPATGFSISGEQDRYAKNYEMLSQVLEMYPDIDLIVYALFWEQAIGYQVVAAKDGQKSTLSASLKTLIETHSDKQFVLLEDTPHSPVLGPASLARAAYLNPATAAVPWTTYLQQLEQQRALLDDFTAAPNARSTPVYGELCNAEECKGLVEGKLLYRDTDHLSEAASLDMEPFFRDLLTSALGIEDEIATEAEVE